LDVEAERILLEPAETGVGGGPAVFVFAETGDGAVVNDFSFGVAPAAVDDLVHGYFVDVARDDAVDEAGGVGPVTRYLKSGEMSMRAAEFLIALYSCS